MKKHLLRISTLWLLLVAAVVTRAEVPATATWDFTNADVVKAVTALAGSSEAGTVKAVEDNGLLLTVEANGQTIRDNSNSIQTGNGVVFKVPVQGKKDVVTVVGFSAPYFAYSIAGTDATEATTTYTAKAADVAKGYVEVVNKGQYLISIKVEQNVDDSADEPGDEPVAQDVTGTWNYGNTGIMDATMAFSGSSQSGEVEAQEKNGLKMTVEANGASFRANGNNIQVGQGAVFKIPVKNAGDLVTVNGYPGYSKYTIGNSTTVLTQDNTYKAKKSDAEVGFVAVTSADNNNYYYSISVTQYAPKEKVTLDNEAVTATFPFNQGKEGQKATFSGDYFLSSKVSVGSNFTYNGVGAVGNQTKLNSGSKEKAAAETNAIRFLITPKPGFVFTPVKVSFKATRYGTNGGMLDFAWQNADGTTVALDSEKQANRDNADPNISLFSYDITNATAGEGACGLLINLYSLDANKNLGFSDIVIEGTLSGTEKEVPVLESFKLNGTPYTVEDVFGELYEATIELSKTATMVSKENPLTDITAANGEVGTVSYESTESACKVTIPMTAGETTMSYVLNIVQKPDFTLTYFDIDGTIMGTQTIEKDAKIGTFAVDYNTAKAPMGEKVRGWFKTSFYGEKFTTESVITADTKLYAVSTEIEEASGSKKYTFNLTDQQFDPADHEAFNTTNGYFHDGTHGWAFKDGDKIELLVGTKAAISIGLCRYGNGTSIVATDAKGNTVATVDGVSKTETDGEVVAFNYEGEAGTLTLTMQATGEMYLHNVKIVNLAETNFDSDGQWFFVKAGDASSLIDVIDAVSAKNMTADAERAYIFVPNGTYDLKQTTLTTISGHNVSLIGESMEGVIIKNRPAKEGIDLTATLLNTGSNNYFQDLTLDCIAPYQSNNTNAERGVCLQDKGNQTVCKNVYMKGLQDIYYSNNNSGTFYFEDSKFEGTVDYICGNGDVYINKSLLYNTNRSAAQGGSGNACIAAPNTKKQFGYIFNDCTIDGTDKNAGNYRLGRPWAESGAIVRYINTTMNILPSALGWDQWSPAHPAEQMGEYNSVDANGKAVDLSGRCTAFASQANNPVITADEAANYKPEAIFNGEWKPFVLAAQLDAPANATYADGKVTWTPANNGAVAYLLEKNGTFVGITEGTSFDVTVDAATDALTIRAANARGGFGKPAPVAGTVNSVKTIQATTANPTFYTLQGIRVSNPTRGLYITNGKKVMMK